MKKLYFDRTENKECMSVFVKGAEVVNAGATICSMPQSDYNEEYQRFADDYDIHFLFDGNVPEIDFYTVPQFDIMATDSDGGYFGTMEGDSAVGYIDKDKNCFLIAASVREFVANAATWKEKKKLYSEIRIFRSREEAKNALEFIEISKYAFPVIQK